MTFGPHLIVVARGRSVARFGALELAYDSCQYLVALGDGTFEGEILEARPDAQLTDDDFAFSLRSKLMGQVDRT